MLCESCFTNRRSGGVQCVYVCVCFVSCRRKWKHSNKYKHTHKQRSCALLGIRHQSNLVFLIVPNGIAFWKCELDYKREIHLWSKETDEFLFPTYFRIFDSVQNFDILFVEFWKWENSQIMIKKTYFDEYCSELPIVCRVQTVQTVPFHFISNNHVCRRLKHNPNMQPRGILLIKSFRYDWMWHRLSCIRFNLLPNGYLFNYWSVCERFECFTHIYFHVYSIWLRVCFVSVTGAKILTTFLQADLRWPDTLRGYITKAKRNLVIFMNSYENNSRDNSKQRA